MFIAAGLSLSRILWGTLEKTVTIHHEAAFRLEREAREAS